LLFVIKIKFFKVTTKISNTLDLTGKTILRRDQGNSGRVRNATIHYNSYIFGSFKLRKCRHYKSQKNFTLDVRDVHDPDPLCDVMTSALSIIEV